MSYNNCIEKLEEAKKELINEKQFVKAEIKFLLVQIDLAIEAITNQWGK
jgi:hypothetical protein